jgi:dihydrofolate reductase
MRKVILSTNVTLDGFMAGPHGELDWHFSHWNDEMEEYITEQGKSIDTILVGRVAYQSMADYWPTIAANPSARRKDLEFAEWMNSLPKIVFSKTLKEVGWNNSRLVKEKIPEEIAKVKQQPGKDMIMWGGVSIVNTFIKLGLIDEYQIWVAPVVLGNGKSPFKSIPKRRSLTLVKTKTFSNGVVILYYKQSKKN